MGDTTKGSVYSDEFLAMERKVARLEQNLRNARALLGRESMRVVDLEKQLVERDVYEAQQILPPEQASLIKHLKTVERCIEEGPVSYSYAESSECQFCTEWQTGAHTRECAWLALQFDRKPEATMTMVHEHALNEHETWKRRQKPASTATGIREWLANAPPPAVYRQPTIEELRRARLAVEESRERLMAQPYQGFNVVPAYSPRDPEISHAFSVLPPEQRRSLILGEWPEGSQVVNMTHDSITVDVPVAPNLGIGGEEPTEVAPPDDEDVP